MAYRSGGCRKRYCVCTHSVMAESKLGCRISALVIYLMSSGIRDISSMKPSRELGTMQK